MAMAAVNTVQYNTNTFTNNMKNNTQILHNNYTNSMQILYKYQDQSMTMAAHHLSIPFKYFAIPYKYKNTSLYKYFTTIIQIPYIYFRNTRVQSMSVATSQWR